jgi:hypothetical protein
VLGFNLSYNLLDSHDVPADKNRLSWAFSYENYRCFRNSASITPIGDDNQEKVGRESNNER